MTQGHSDPASNGKSKHTFANKLSSQQKSALKGKAHSLKPVVQVGGGGISETLAGEIKRALLSHELIKIQVPGQCSAAEKNTTVDAILQVLPEHSHLVDRIGRMVIVYLEKHPEDNPNLSLKSLA